MTYKAVSPRYPSISDDWTVEREIMCINGLRAWFLVATVHEPDAAEIGYTEGEIGSAQERAETIAAALTLTKGR